MEVEIVRVTEKLMADGDTAAALAPVLPDNFSLPGFDGIVMAAIEEDAPAGAICIRDGNRTDISWLYVEPELRRKGIASELLRRARELALTEFVSPELIGEIEIDDSLQSDLLGFFDSVEDVEIDVTGCFYEAEPDVIRETVEKEVLFKKADQAGIEELDKLADAELLGFFSRPAISDVFEVTDPEDWKRAAVPELCLFSKKNREISNIIITSKTGENMLSLDFIYSKDPAKMGEMISVYGKRLVSEYPDCGLIMRPINEQSYNIMEHLFSRVKVRGYVCEVSFW